MTIDEVVVAIQEVLETDFQISKERLTPDATFRGSLGMDSMDAVDLIYLLTKRFGIPTQLHDFASLHTIRSVAEYVTRQVAKKAAGAPQT